MKSNKKAQVGKEWIFGLAFLFALTIIYLTFNSVYNAHLAPIIISTLPNTTAGLEATNGINDWLRIWEFMPYILMGVTFIYLMILTIKKEPVERDF